MDSATLRRAAQWRLQGYQRRLLARVSKPVVTTPVELVSTAGYKLSAALTRPAGTDRLPGLVVSPGIHQGRAAVEGQGAVVNAGELARLGFVVLTYDPAGRGESWGDEDYGGPEHQDDLRVAVRQLRAEPGCNGKIGIVSLSLGIASAAGALARWPDEIGASFLLDWEGPCDREIITSGGTIMVPAAGHGLDDDAYWVPREATRSLAGVRCGYVRLQAVPDHAQPQETRHAMRMMAAAKAASLPWCQLNDHVRGEVPQRPAWIRGGPWAANQAILRKVRALRGGM